MHKDTIDIYGNTYTVARPEKIIIDGKENDGASSYTTREIEVKRDLPAGYDRYVFVHEVAHIAMSENGLSEWFTPEQREAICDLCASVCETIRKYEAE